jgi:hypothetical protein
LRSRLRTSRIVALVKVIYGFLSLQKYCFWVAYYWRIEYTTTTIVVIDATVMDIAIVKILTTTTSKRAKYRSHTSYTTTATIRNPLDKWGVPGKGLREWDELNLTFR